MRFEVVLSKNMPPIPSILEWLEEIGMLDDLQTLPDGTLVALDCITPHTFRNAGTGDALGPYVAAISVSPQSNSSGVGETARDALRSALNELRRMP
jgi:glycerol dehydrogenase-like iron-containing ADH family enzyme